MIRVYDRDQFLMMCWTRLEHIPAPACVELGVYRGDFAESIYKIIYPCLLVMIDPFDTGRIMYKNGQPTAYSSKDDYDHVVKRFKGKYCTILRKYSYNAVGIFKDQDFDFIYHDASHLYEDIKRDLNDWLPKLRKGGLMCGHDYIDHEDFGVKQAVDEFCAEHNFEMIIFNENGGDYALRAIQ